MNCYNCGSEKLVCNNETDCYVCKDCNYSHPKQYFFISHSHQDIEKVRIIRNVIEETFFYEPILFFLKCLSNEEEIHELIKREIYERIWFVYCKSKNAENSKYVQFERSYIQSLIEGGKQIKILEIDLDKYEIWDEGCAEYLRNQIAYKIKKTKIFFSYAHRDSKQAFEIADILKNNGFTLFMDTDMTVGDIWFDTVNRQIKRHALKDGAMLCLFSNGALDSHAFISELKEAKQTGAFIIPLIYENDKERLDALIKKIKDEGLIDENFAPFVVTDGTIKIKTQELCKYLLNY